MLQTFSRPAMHVVDLVDAIKKDQTTSLYKRVRVSKTKHYDVSLEY